MEFLTALRSELIDLSAWISELAGNADGLAVTIALLTPVLLLIGRREIRFRRLIALRNLVTSYPALAERGLNADRYVEEIDPSFKYVKEKYVADDAARARDSAPLTQIENAIRLTRSLVSMSEMRMLLASVGLIIVTYYGMTSFRALLTSGFALPLAANAAGECHPGTAREQAQLIATITFAGAFVAALRVFIRGLAVFDLSTYTILRQTAEIMTSVIIVLFLYKAFPDPLAPFEALLAGKSVTEPRCDVSWIWLALAPLLGFLPSSAAKFLMVKLQSAIRWVKQDDDRFAPVTRVVTVDVIDGIDYYSRFRLEECGIYDVQNLATYNPILLHVESPFPFYQSVDWVAQAQLCHLLGLEKFQFLRNYNIRTIFDLERAIDFKSRGETEKPAIDGPNEFDRIYASILFAPTNTLRQAASIGDLRPLILKGKTVEPANVDEYCAWAYQEIQPNGDPANVKACVEHMMGWIADDLHVRRLRRIWQEMSDSLGMRTVRLDNLRVNEREGKAEGRRSAKDSLPL